VTEKRDGTAEPEQPIEDLDVEDTDDVRGGYRGRYELRLSEASGQTQPPPTTK
jgi:hypothetical protein